MERLQIALEKARAARTRTQPASDEAAPSTAPLKLDGMQITAHKSEINWDGLTPLEIDRKRRERKRIAAFAGGENSAPFDLLRTRVLQQARQHGWRRIALVSPHSGCGKSTTAANLAFSIARQREIHSITMDLDFRRAGLTDILGGSAPYGMAAVLERRVPMADVVLRYGVNTLFGPNTGTRTRTPSEILQSAQTSEVLKDIENSFAPDIMLFDLPPMLASDDNFGFLQNVDCALILVASEKTPMSQIDVTERHVAELTTVMGIVLNKCRYKSKTHSHEYDYY